MPNSNAQESPEVNLEAATEYAPPQIAKAEKLAEVTGAPVASGPA